VTLALRSLASVLALSGCVDKAPPAVWPEPPPPLLAQPIRPIDSEDPPAKAEESNGPEDGAVPLGSAPDAGEDEAAPPSDDEAPADATDPGAPGPTEGEESDG
jgi:hypothetical protein